MARALAIAAALGVALSMPAQAQPDRDDGDRSLPQLAQQDQRQPIQPAPPAGGKQTQPAAGNPAPKADDVLSADKLGDQLIATRHYIERHWLWMRLLVLAQAVPESEINTTLQPIAQDMGTRGPSQAELAYLDTGLANAIDAFLDGIEERIRSGRAQWPGDKSPVQYANASLIGLETVRLEVGEARKGKGDLFLAMRRANGIANLTMGGKKEDRFAGRDEAVELAMKAAKPTTPTAPKR